MEPDSKRLTARPSGGDIYFIRRNLIMINIRDLRIDPTSLGAKKLLVDIAPAYEYKDNKRTENVTGYRYTVALPEHSLEKLGVKIEGKQLMDKPEGFAEVEFSGLEVFMYVANGQPVVGARATGISLANKKP
jgi:hypothetical protein